MCLLQISHDTLLQFGSTDLQALLQITGEGGAWSNPVLTSLLTGQPTNPEEGWNLVKQLTHLGHLIWTQRHRFYLSLSHWPCHGSLLIRSLHFIASWCIHQFGGRGLHGDAGEAPGEDGRSGQSSGAGQSLHWMQLHLKPSYLSSNLCLPALSPAAQWRGHHGGIITLCVCIQEEEYLH